MCLYLRIKFHDSSLILTTFRQGVILRPPHRKMNPKTPNQLGLITYDLLLPSGIKGVMFLEFSVHIID